MTLTRGNQPFQPILTRGTNTRQSHTAAVPLCPLSQGLQQLGLSLVQDLLDDYGLSTRLGGQDTLLVPELVHRLNSMLAFVQEQLGGKAAHTTLELTSWSLSALSFLAVEGEWISRSEKYPASRGIPQRTPFLGGVGTLGIKPGSSPGSRSTPVSI
jgi:hypothetical protein